jgi:hypothetical protein
MHLNSDICGNGDNTKERQEWLPDKFDDVKSDLIERQKERKTKNKPDYPPGC